MPDRTEWWDNIRKKHPNKTDKEIKAMFAEWAKQRKVRGTGGFYRNPALAKQAQQKSVEARLKNKKEE